MIKSFAVLILAVTLCAVPTVTFAATPRVPFAAKDVPNELDSQWQLRPRYSYDDYYQLKRFYKTDSGLRLGVYSYFGQLVFKAWACRNAGEDPTTKDVPDHMIAVLKDGNWYSVHAQSPQIFVESDANGKAIKVTVVLRDSETEKEIIRRVITR